MKKYFHIILFLLIAHLANGWSEAGHKTIALMTWSLLSPATQTKVTELLPSGVDIISASTWPDEIRHQRPATKGWHYIELPVREKVNRINIRYFRSRTKDDVLSQTEKCISELKAATADKERLQEDLMFLIHFIGDIHMPLHCAGDNDRGGNEKAVRLFKNNDDEKGRKLNLHALWDHLIMVNSGDIDVISFADSLIKTISADERATIAKGSPEEWALETYGVAKKRIYKELPPGKYKEAFHLPKNYSKKMRPIANKQLVRAAVRLAHVLNETLH
jgi:hypothetical protein